MFENGQPVDSMKVIVGTSEFPTPLIASMIYYVTLNPYWNAPDHWSKRRSPRMSSGRASAISRARGYEVMADWTDKSAVIPPDQIDWKAVAAGKKQIRVRQKPGPSNFMAKMKIPFPNGEDIYLHDTPTKSLFRQSTAGPEQRLRPARGCQALRPLADGRHDPVASSTDPELQIQLKQAMPIYLTYLTAQPSNGKVTYPADFYGWDKSAISRVAAR